MLCLYSRCSLAETYAELNIFFAVAGCLGADRVCTRPFYCTENDLIASSENCHQFYQCIYGYWYLYDCAAGSNFDANICACALDGNAQCGETCSQPTHLPPIGNGIYSDFWIEHI